MDLKEQYDKLLRYCYMKTKDIHYAEDVVKDMGFKLSDIIKILDIYDDRNKLDSYLEARKIELEAMYKQTTYQMMLLNTARNRLRKEDNMSYNVSIKTIPERYAATVHMTLPNYEDEGMVWKIMTEETASLNLVEADPCLVAASYLDDEYKEENVVIVRKKFQFVIR